MSAKETAREEIRSLVDKFLAQSEAFAHTGYNESRLRVDFLNPFFKYLGWDVTNEAGTAERYREVIYEERIYIEGTTKHPDYAFRIGSGSPLFYVEAKKPGVNIKDNPEPALQLRKYGWNTGKAVSVLTNFKEFAVYDCTQKIRQGDKASAARIAYLTCQDYTNTVSLGNIRDGFEFLWNTFSREGVRTGGFDKYTEKIRDRKGILTVDKDFLQLLDTWREKLAKTFIRLYPQITEEEINTAVPQLIDRLVFLRVAEDRGVEPKNIVKNAVAGHNCYDKLYRIFTTADEKYNSGLFDLDNDAVGKKITVDDATLKRMVNDLYDSNPYDFALIPLEILGTAYEHFLGKIIRITEGRNVKVETKPEVRKAGGVFYTPEYIVNFITEETVGKLLENKTPQEAAKIKIVDPACGSGTFLLGAYRYLLDWHLDYYKADYQKRNEKPRGRKTDTLTPDGQLTTKVKKDILLNNIFGVDIDMTAVEVTKLSLLLKCMEGETPASIETAKLFHERVLPNINGNICSGNSLVDTDFYELDFGEPEEKTAKPFNWQRTFPQVFKQGGFDAVISNPPWGADLRADKSYFKQHYKNQTQDSAAFFLEKGTKLSLGKIGMIVPKTIAFYSAWNSIRELLLQIGIPSRICDAGIAFSQVNLESVMLIFDKKETPKQTVIYNAVPLKLPYPKKEIEKLGTFDKRVTEITKAFPMIALSKKQAEIILKIYGNSVKLGDVAADIFRGVYIPDNVKETLRRGKTKWINKVPDVQRWQLAKVMNIALPQENKAKAEKVAVPRIFFKVLRGSKLIVFPDVNGEYVTTEKLVNVTLNQSKYPASYLFLAGVINAAVTSWYLQKVLFSDTTETSRAMDKLYSQYIPLPQLDLSKKADKQIHDKIVHYAGELLKLYPYKNTVTLSEHQRTVSKIEHYEEQINRIVYELYTLTNDEIKIIEGK
ncbi:MAG: N-6 DNA methylase [Planctomycetaceae bacterium]|jgi:type I restriction-modification system DNA methylase subunit|nr:N-6 DNA methylase [Planctomycetaceae bacterium]